jgi:hypothetical protein
MASGRLESATLLLLCNMHTAITSAILDGPGLLTSTCEVATNYSESVPIGTYNYSLKYSSRLVSYYEHLHDRTLTSRPKRHDIKLGERGGGLAERVTPAGGTGLLID